MAETFLFLFIMSSFSVWCAAKTEKRFEQTLPVGYLASIVIMFLFAVANLLLVGFYVLLSLCAVLYIWSAVVLARQRNWKVFRDKLLTPGALFYVALAFVLTLLNTGRLVHGWDEFSHWADAVKVMYQYDTLPAIAPAFSAYSSYPPGMTLFQYLYFKVADLIAPGRGFVEAYCYTAHQLLTFSILLPFSARLNKRKKMLIPVYVVLMLLLPMMFHNLLVYTFIDGFFAIVSGAGLTMIWLTKQEERDWFYHAYIALCCVMLVLCKDAALLFAVMLAIAYILCQNVTGQRSLIYRLWILLPMVVTKALWSIVTAVCDAQTPFAAENGITSYLGILMGSGRAEIIERLSIFVTGMFEKTIPFGNTGISPSLIFILFLSFAFILGVSWIMEETKVCAEQTRVHGGNAVGIIPVMVIIQAILFVVGICFVYLFEMTYQEAASLQDIERYFGSAVLPAFIIASFAMLRILEDRINWGFIPVMTVLCVMLTFLPVRPVIGMLSRSYVSAGYSARENYGSMVERISNVCEPGSRIWYISQETNGEGFWKVKFLARPCLVTNVNQWSLTVPVQDDLCFSVDKSASEWWSELMKDYDYVALQVIDDHFVEVYGILFENPDDIREGEIYRVDKQNQNLVLCEIVE